MGAIHIRGMVDCREPGSLGPPPPEGAPPLHPPQLRCTLPSAGSGRCWNKSRGPSHPLSLLPCQECSDPRRDPREHRAGLGAVPRAQRHQYAGGSDRLIN